MMPSGPMIQMRYILTMSPSRGIYNAINKDFNSRRGCGIPSRRQSLHTDKETAVYPDLALLDFIGDTWNIQLLIDGLDPLVL